MKVEIIDITDASGSMDKLRGDVIGGFNMLLKEQKEVTGSARFTHVQFDHEYSPKYAGVPISQVKPMTAEDYVPRGTTALLDAIGRTLNEQGKRIALENWADKVIVCIRTDGHENASKEYTASRIKEMIGHAQKCGWVFVFTAANQDAFATGASYGISGAHTQTFDASSGGMGQSYAFASSTLRDLRVPDKQAHDTTLATPSKASKI